MEILARHVNPDGALVLVVARGSDGQVAVGFDGGSWHTHPDLISHWLNVPLEQALDYFIEQLKADCLPVIMSTDGGATIDPWISDAFRETEKMYGCCNLVLRSWSGERLKPDI